MALTSTKSASAHRFHLQDALRGIAAFLIACYHAPGYLRLSFPNGFLAVDFFFCLSGFVMVHAYEERLMQKMTVRGFLAVRTIRLLPLYVLATVIALLRFPLNRERLAYAQQHPASVLFIAACGLIGFPNLIGTLFSGFLYPFDLPAWSLAYEVLANAGYAVSVRKRITLPALVTACALSLSYLLFVALSHGLINEGAEMAGWKTALARVGFSFSTGALLYKLSVHRKLVPRPANLWAAVLVFLFTMTLLLSTPWAQEPAFRVACIAVFFPAVVYAAAGITVSGAALAIAIFLGDMSYPLYVLVEPLMPPIVRSPALVSAQHPYLVPVCGMASIALIACLSWFISRKLELPLRRKLTQRLNAA